MKTLVPLEFLPGLFTLKTDRGAKNRWRDGDHVRWYRGTTQKIGGWTRTVTNTFLGICRCLIDWQSVTASENIIALGTHLKLYVEKSGTFYDITPYRETGTLNGPFDTTNTLATVTVNDTGHGLAVGDYVHFTGAVAGGGITIDGEYTVTSVTSVNVYVITHSAAATSTVAGTGGANVGYSYEISIGRANTAGLGWGVGAWGTGTWGTARPAALGMCRIWSMDLWGEDLIACPRGGGIYQWDTSVGTGTRAAAVAGSPTTAKAVLTSIENRHLIALGAYDGAANDPLLIRWSDSDDNTVWTAATTNTAGSKRIDGGNEIYCGVKVGREILVHTDSVCVAMVFEGPPYTFGFYPRGSNGNLAGPNAAKEFDGRCWWMGSQDFFVYDGRVRVLPCEVRNHVFEDISISQRAKIFAGANRWFGEVWWLYPAAGSTECDRYVLYNVLENHWSFGTLVRTAFLGDSSLFGPYATGSDGYIYDHESGVDDNTSALATDLTSWDIEIGNGEHMMRISKLIPDFESLSGSVDFSIAGRRYPESSAQTTQSLGSASSTTEFLNANFRARQISLTLSTDAVGDNWGIGTLRLEVSPHGKQ